jgi:hypothetical protein
MREARTLAAFVASGDLDRRDALASRASGLFMQPPLSDLERAELDALDAELNELSPAPMPLSAEVQQILREVLG